MTGHGIFAEQMRTMFDISTRRAGLNQAEVSLSTEHFRKPGEQLEMKLGGL